MRYIAKRSTGAAEAPLVLTFHGTGGSEEQFHALAGDLVSGAHVTSPRGDVMEGTMARYFRRTGEGRYDMADLAQRVGAMGDFVAAEVARTQARRVIGLGYSNGANILAALALERPDLVGEMILMHPLIPWDPAPQPGLAGRRVLITAGRFDPICPAPRTEALALYLTQQGAEVTLHWHGGGHEIDASEIAAMQAFLG